MKRSLRTTLACSIQVFLTFLGGFVLLASPQRLMGQDVIPQPKAAEFVEALRTHNYPDIAIEYLNTIQKENTVPATLKEEFDYQMAELHKFNAVMQPSLEGQLAEIENSYNCYTKFIKEKSTHAKIREAARNFSELMMMRGSLYRDLATKSKNKPEEEIQGYWKKSRDSFTEARTEFDANVSRARDVIKKLQSEKKSSEEMDEAILDFLQARIASASTYYEIAQTYPKDAKEYKENLATAAKSYNELFEKYGAIESPYFAGLLARLREGRIKMDLGELDEVKGNKGAIGIFIETMTLGYDPGFRKLTEEALQYLCMAAVQKNDKELMNSTLLKFSEWYTKEMNPSDRGKQLALEVQLAGSKLAVALMKTATDEEKATKEYRDLRKRTQEIVSFLLKTGLKDDAEPVMADLGGPSAGDKKPEAMNYEELLEEAQARWDFFRAASSQVSESADNPEALKTAAAAQMKAAQDALYICRLLELKRPENIRNKPQVLQQYNSNRFLSAYAMFLTNDSYGAIMMGEFLAKNYPNAKVSKEAANLTVKILRKQFADQRKKLRDSGATEDQVAETLMFEANHLARLAQVIAVRTQEDGPAEGDEAWNMVCDTFVELGEIKKAKFALEKISETSEYRANAEIRTGNALWNMYLKGMRADLSKKPKQEVLDAYKEQSQKILQDGMDRMKKALGEGEEPSLNLVYAAYTLAYLKLNSGDAAGAVALLNDPKIGPLTLIKKDAPVMAKNGLDVNTLRVSLRALVASQQLDDAQAVMELLEKRVSAQAANSEAEKEGETKVSKEEELTKIYIQLGQELEENLELLNKEGKAEEAQNLAKGFEIFLKRIAERKEGNTFASLVWVAEMYKSLGASVAAGKQNMPPQAKAYYEEAAKTYDLIYGRITEDPNFVTQKSADQIILVRLAKCLIASEQYDKAIEKVGKQLLSKNPNNIEVQVDAAQSYMDWASKTSDKAQQADLFKKALYGSSEYKTEGQKDAAQNGKPAIWGWNALANKMSQQMSRAKANANDERFAPTYFSARLAVATIYEQQADALEGDAKTKQLEKAEKILVQTHKLYPTLRDEETFAKYNTMLLKVRRDMGVKNAKGFSDIDTARGFAAKGDYQQAIDKILGELKKESTLPSTIASVQEELARYYVKLAGKSEELRDQVKYYKIALEGDPDQKSSGGKPIVLGWEKILSQYQESDGKPVKGKLIEFLTARLAIAEIQYEGGMLRKSVDRTEDAQKCFDEATTILFDDFKAYANMKSETPELGNPDLLGAYEFLAKKIQAAEGKEEIGFTDPAELEKQKALEAQADEKPEDKPVDMTMIYGVIGGSIVVAFILTLIFLWPKKRAKVEKRELAISKDGGLAVDTGAPQEEKVNLGFAQETQAQEKVDLGFGGFGGPSNGKVDLGFGNAGSEPSSFSFDLGGKSNQAPNQKSVGAPGQRPANAPGQRPSGAPGQRPSGAPGQRPAGAPGQRPSGAPGQRPANAQGQRPAGAPGQRPANAQGQRPAQQPAAKPANPQAPKEE